MKQRRTERIAVRFTKTEKVAVEKLAGKRDIPAAQLIREATKRELTVASVDGVAN